MAQETGRLRGGLSLLVIGLAIADPGRARDRARCTVIAARTTVRPRSGEGSNLQS
jgi:hypothetical protein